jgi:small neutral amino acid transporter SnatA (MarC family)
MTDRKNVNPYYSRGLYRVVTGIFGLFLAGVGIYVAFFGVVDPVFRFGGGLLFALIGGNAVWSAIQSKESWLSTIGPMP